MHAAKHMEKLKPLLEKGGNEVIAVELPGLGEDKSDPLAATLESHVSAIIAAVDRAASPVVLVGHSLAGVTISAARGCGLHCTCNRRAVRQILPDYAIQQAPIRSENPLHICFCHRRA